MKCVLIDQTEGLPNKTERVCYAFVKLLPVFTQVVQQKYAQLNQTKANNSMTNIMKTTTFNQPKYVSMAIRKMSDCIWLATFQSIRFEIGLCNGDGWWCVCARKCASTQIRITIELNWKETRQPNAWTESFKARNEWNGCFCMRQSDDSKVYCALLTQQSDFVFWCVVARLECEKIGEISADIGTKAYHHTIRASFVERRHF